MVGSAAVSRSGAISTEGAATIRPSDDPSHFLANLLHLVYRGKKLKADHVNAAQELLDDNPELMPELLHFMLDTLPLLRALLHFVSDTLPLLRALLHFVSDTLPLLRALLHFVSDTLPLLRALLHFVSDTLPLLRALLHFMSAKLCVISHTNCCLCQPAKHRSNYRFLRGKEEIDW